MELLLNGISIPIAQMGPDFLILTETIDQPPSNATLVMQVDEIERQWDVRLSNGISSGSKRVAISLIQ